MVADVQLSGETNNQKTSIVANSLSPFANQELNSEMVKSPLGPLTSSPMRASQSSYRSQELAAGNRICARRIETWRSAVLARKGGGRAGGQAYAWAHRWAGRCTEGRAGVWKGVR